MCLIVDANVATQVFTPTPAPDFQPLWNSILAGGAVAVHGGHLSVEYARISALTPLLLELERQGKVRQVPHDLVQTETERFRAQSLQSDDPHILGLASVAKVRLLCSHDTNLHADFTNPAFLQPSGSVYQTASHRHLIRRHCGARTRKSRQRRTRKKP